MTPSHPRALRRPDPSPKVLRCDTAHEHGTARLEAARLEERSLEPARPTRAEAEDAVRTLLRYTGDDSEREGLLDTPARVVRAFDEFFAGYAQDPDAVLARTFEEVEGYDEMVLVRDIDFVSHCEHHMVSFTGRAHVAYVPDGRVVGLSKLARVVDVFARRLQIQEKLTVQIAESIERVLRPKGVAVLLEAGHDCMSTRGVRKPDARTVTSRYSGVFRTDAELRREFTSLIRGA